MDGMSMNVQEAGSSLASSSHYGWNEYEWSGGW